MNRREVGRGKNWGKEEGGERREESRGRYGEEGRGERRERESCPTSGSMRATLAAEEWSEAMEECRQSRESAGTQLKQNSPRAAAAAVMIWLRGREMGGGEEREARGWERKE